MKYAIIALKQRHIEDWSASLPPASETKVPVFHGAVVRCAAKAGWFDPPMKETEVGDMLPGEVKALAEMCMAEYTRVLDISPE
jgi:hypothetical protein